MSEYSLFIKRVGLVGIARFIGRLKGIILLPILAKTFGAAGYGVWVQIGVTVALVMPFVMLGLDSAMLRFLSEKRQKKAFAKGFFTTVFVILVVSVIFALLLFLLSEPFARIFLKDASIAPLIRIASFLIILEALITVCLEPFRILGQVRKYAILIILKTLIEVGLVSSLVLLGFGLSGAIIGLLITRGVILLLSLFFIIRQVGFSLPDFSIIRPYLLFGLPLIPSVLFLVIIESSDRYVIGFFKGVASIGIYSAAYGLGVIPAMFIGPLSYILAPTIFKFYRDGELKKVKTFLSYSLKYFLLLAIPSVFGLFILAESLLRILTTPEFVSITSALIVLLLSLSMVFEGVRAIFGTTLMIFKKTKVLAKGVFIAGAVNLILNIILIPHFGIIAAAATTLIAYVLLGFLMYYYSRKYMKFNINLNFILKSISASVIMASVIYLINPIGIISILFAIGTGVIIYFGLIFLLKGFEKKELKTISSALKLNKIYERL